MGLAPRTVWTLRHYWADRLGVSPAAFEATDTTVGSAAVDGIHVVDGIQIFCRGDALVVAAPPAHVDSIDNHITALSSCDDDAIRAWLTGLDDVGTVLGPIFYGYTDREAFRPVDSDARVLDSDDTASFRSFRRAIPEDEWDVGGSSLTPGETVGVFADGDLVAVAGFAEWDGLLAHLTVVTHPTHRNQGYGRAVVSRATSQALTDGLIPQYRTADRWPQSVGLAQRLGFHRFATAYLGRYHP